MDRSRGYQRYGEQSNIISSLFLFRILLMILFFFFVSRLKNYTGTIFFSPHLALHFSFPIRKSKLFISESGGNTQLLAIKTQHSLEKVNITKSMMF